MREVLFENQFYKEFESSDEGNNWGWKYFGDVLTPNENPAFESVFFYTGSMSRKWNKILRRNPSIESGQFENTAKSEFVGDTDQIRRIIEVNSLLQNHNIPENIVVYRYTDKKVVKKLCSTHILREGMHFKDKGFLSTTLVSDLLLGFAQKHSCNCLMKIYVPKGTRGAYVSIKHPLAKLNEQEILLAPNLQIEIVKVHRFSHPFLIECKIV